MTTSDDQPARTLNEPRISASAFWRAFPAGMNRRWWLFRLFDMIARYLPWPTKRRGLLVVRMDGIGDMVLFRTSLDAYAATFGVDQSDITVLGCHSWRGIADKVFAGYRVVTIDEHAYARRLLYRFRVNLMVRGFNVETAVCDSYFRRALMSDSLVWVSGAPSSVVSLPYINEPNRVAYTYYLSQVSRIIDTGPYPTHEVDRHYRFLSAIAKKELAAVAPHIDWQQGPSLIEAGAPYVVLNPGSNEYGRRWPLALYAAIGHRALAAGYRVVVVGAGAEKVEDDAMKALVAAEGTFDKVGKTSLTELIDIMSQAACVLTNDTGPAHLAIAVGAPTVVVVGGGHFGSFVPYPETACPANARFVWQEMDCYHCFWRCPKRATKFDTFPCVAAVTEEAVWMEMSRLLDPDEKTAT